MDIGMKFFLPREGQLVRHPVTKAIIPEGGGMIDWTGPIGRFFRKRVKDGDGTVSDSRTGKVIVEEKKVKKENNKWQ